MFHKHSAVNCVMAKAGACIRSSSKMANAKDIRNHKKRGVFVSALLWHITDVCKRSMCFAFLHLLTRLYVKSSVNVALLYKHWHSWCFTSSTHSHTHSLKARYGSVALPKDTSQCEHGESRSNYQPFSLLLLSMCCFSCYRAVGDRHNSYGDCSWCFVKKTL